MDRQLIFASLFRHREALLLLLSVPVVTCALRGNGLERPDALLGVALVTAGVMLRLTTVRRIGRGARVFRPHASAGLIAAGPYRWSRNPLYLAAALMLSGLGLIAGAGWVAVALFPATLLAYTPVVLAEENALAELLGEEYIHYLGHVPRWLGIPGSWFDPHSSRVGWSEVFRREKALVPGTTAAVLAIVAVQQQWIPSRGIAERLELAFGLDLAWLVAAAAGITVVVNAIKVELHQRQRRASRAARAHSTIL